MSLVPPISGIPGLRSVRKINGLAQSALAGHLECTIQTISRLEMCGGCSIDHVRALCAFLYCEPADLMNEPTPERLVELKALRLEGEAAQVRREQMRARQAS